MKKEIVILVSSFFIISMTAISGVYAVEEEEKMELIKEVQSDLTGDGKDEMISVKGLRFNESEPFYKNLHVEVLDHTGEINKIELEGGANPRIQFKDINQDGIKDMFISVSTSGSGGLSNFYLYTYKDKQIVDLTTPDPLTVQSEFLDGYKAKIHIENNNKTHKFNLKSRADDYEETGLYFNSKLNEPMELMVNSYDRLEPVKLKGKKIGLKGNQMLSGAYHADIIGRIESTWEYENGEWNLLKTKVFETQYKKGED
jgi:hypothetical protein